MRQLKSPYKKFARLRFFSSPLSLQPHPSRGPETLSPSSSNHSLPNPPLSNHTPHIPNTLIAIHHKYTPNPTLKPTRFHSSIHPLLNASIKITFEKFRPTPFFFPPPSPTLKPRLIHSTQCVNQKIPLFFFPTDYVFFFSLPPLPLLYTMHQSIKTQ